MKQTKRSKETYTFILRLIDYNIIAAQEDRDHAQQLASYRSDADRYTGLNQCIKDLQYLRKNQNKILKN